MIGRHFGLLAFRVLDNFEENSERVIGFRFRMNEEDSGSARAFAGSLVDDPEAAGFHRVKGLLRVLYAESDVGQASAAAIFVDQFLHWRVGSEGLKQLNQDGTVADLEQRFAHLIGSQDFFAMNFAEAQHFIGFHLTVEFTLLDGDGNVVDELNPWNLLQVIGDAAHHLTSLNSFGADRHTVLLIRIRYPRDSSLSRYLGHCYILMFPAIELVTSVSIAEMSGPSSTGHQESILPSMNERAFIESVWARMLDAEVKMTRSRTPDYTHHATLLIRRFVSIPFGGQGKNNEDTGKLCSRCNHRCNLSSLSRLPLFCNRKGSGSDRRAAYAVREDAGA